MLNGIEDADDLKQAIRPATKIAISSVWILEETAYIDVDCVLDVLMGILQEGLIPNDTRRWDAVPVSL